MQVYVALQRLALRDSVWRERDAFLGPGILSPIPWNDGRVEAIIMSACMHRLRSIKVKLSSHLFGVIGQSLFGVFPSLHVRDSPPTS